MLVFLGLLLAYTMWDYVDHVTREGQEFGERPWSWLAFTVASMGVVLITLLAALRGSAWGFARARRGLTSHDRSTTRP